MRWFLQRIAQLARRGLGTQRLERRLQMLERQARDFSRKTDPSASKSSQLLLIDSYRRLAHSGMTLPHFKDVEFRAFSQNGEDGILLYLFALLGMGNRRAVEICAGDGIQSNSANLILNHGWTALLFDGDGANVQRGQRFYAQHPDTFSFPPRFVHAWVTRENVNELIREQGLEGEIDLLSLDLDGIDYWIWDALEVVQPRVIVAEIQCIWGTDRAVTVPYDPEFRTEYVQGFGVYSGGSVQAFIKLAARKGYRFVGVQGLGFNAFFVKNGLAEEVIPAADPTVCLNVPFVRWAQQELLPLVKDNVWVEV